MQSLADEHELVVRQDMVVRLGATVRARIVDSGFASEIDSPLAMEMHVRLNNPARRYRQGFADMAEIAASPAAWEVLGRWCRAQRVQGTNRAEARAFARLGLRIGREIDRLSAHPAYHAQAVMGVEPMVLPAYRVAVARRDPADWPIGPTPTVAIRLANWAAGDIETGEMRPWVGKAKGRVVTFWLWSSALEAPVG
jgi:hypothetical protein